MIKTDLLFGFAAQSHCNYHIDNPRLQPLASRSMRRGDHIASDHQSSSLYIGARRIAQLDKEIAELDEISKKARQDLYETRVNSYIKYFYKARDNMAEIQKLRPEALRLGLHEVVAKVDKWLNRVFSKRFYAPKDMSPASIAAFAHECARRNSDTESLGMMAVASVTRQSKEKLAEAIRAKKQEMGTIELG